MPIKPPPPRYAQHPFEVCITVSFIFSCMSLALFGPAGGNASDYPASFQVTLATAVLFGSVLVLSGAFWPDVIMGAFLELAGMVCMSGFIAAWILGVSSKTDNWSSGLAACSLLSILVACLWRSTQVVQWMLWVYKEHPPEFWKNRALKDAGSRDRELDEILNADYPRVLDELPPETTTAEDIGLEDPDQDDEP